MNGRLGKNLPEEMERHVEFDSLPVIFVPAPDDLLLKVEVHELSHLADSDDGKGC